MCESCRVMGVRERGVFSQMRQGRGVLKYMYTGGQKYETIYIKEGK
jgi:hypothetical protein